MKNNVLLHPAVEQADLSDKDTPTITITMSLFKKITTPNGQEYEQPLGLFINGEVVPPIGGKTIASIDPA